MKKKKGLDKGKKGEKKKNLKDVGDSVSVGITESTDIRTPLCRVTLLVLVV